jgi:hypothetical protein
MAEEETPCLHHGTSYDTHRETSYPSVGTALDAIRKGFRALEAQGMKLPPETLAWLAECDDVKARYRKA